MLSKIYPSLQVWSMIITMLCPPAFVFSFSHRIYFVSNVHDWSCKLSTPQSKIFCYIAESFVLYMCQIVIRLGEVVSYVKYILHFFTRIPPLYAKVQQKVSQIVHRRHCWTLLLEVQIKWRLHVGLLRLVVSKLLRTGHTVYPKLLKKHIATNT